MFEFSELLQWLAVVLAGILLSVIQELAKRWPALRQINQKMVAIGLAVMAGLVAALFEFGLGIDLFADVRTPTDIIKLILMMFAFSQATYSLRR